MKVYLSGPMSGCPAFNIPAFDKAAAYLRDKGHEIVSPAELDDPAFRDLCLLCKTGSMDELHTFCGAAKVPMDSWGDLLARDVKLLADGDIEAIVCLPGWEKSRGARLETFVGRMCGMPILAYPSLNKFDDYSLERVHALPRKESGDLMLEQGKVYHAPIRNDAFFPPGFREDDLGIGTKPPSGAGGLLDNPHVPPELRRKAEAELARGEVRTVDPDTGGEKGVKPERYDLLPWEQLDEVAKLYAFGASKYAPNNWRKGFAWSKCFASMIRHATLFWRGENIDPETKCHHLASVVFHALTLMAFENIHPKGDDRPGSE